VADFLEVELILKRLMLIRTTVKESMQIIGTQSKSPLGG